MRTQPNNNYFTMASSEFREARWQGPGAVVEWCKKFWPLPAAAAVLLFILAALVYKALSGPDPSQIQERLQERLNASGNWSDLRWLQTEPKKDGGTYVALVTYGSPQKYRCRMQSVGGAITLQFYRLGGIRDNGAESTKPKAQYELKADGVLRTTSANDEALRDAAREAIDALFYATAR
jgi:hypothetical protein